MSQTRLTCRWSGAAVLACLAVLLTACNDSSDSEQPFHPHAVYDQSADARADIRQAVAEAGREHKRVLLDFGGNWCGDCQVLDYYLHQPPNSRLLARNFILVDIDIGKYDHNLDLAQQYDIPLRIGVPALAVLSSDGKLLYSQQHGEFETMSRVDPASVTAFLDRWKAPGNG